MVFLPSPLLVSHVNDFQFRFHKSGVCFQFLVMVFSSRSQCTPCQYEKKREIFTTDNLHTFTIWNKIIIWMLIFSVIFRLFCQQKRKQAKRNQKDKIEANSSHYRIRNAKFIHIGCCCCWCFFILVFSVGVIAKELLLLLLLVFVWAVSSEHVC